MCPAHDFTHFSSSSPPTAVVYDGEARQNVSCTQCTIFACAVSVHCTLLSVDAPARRSQRQRKKRGIEEVAARVTPDKKRYQLRSRKKQQFVPKVQHTVQWFYIVFCMRDEKEERKKQARSNKQGKATPKAVIFPRKNELPRVGLQLEGSGFIVRIIITCCHIGW